MVMAPPPAETTAATAHHWDEAHREELAATAQWWMDRGWIVLPVIPIALPADRWPKVFGGKAIADSTTGAIEPKFPGKAPSFWNHKGVPQLLQRKQIESGERKPMPQAEVLRILRTPVTVGPAAEFGSPIGICVMCAPDRVVVDLDAAERNGDLLGRISQAGHYVEATPSGGLHVVVLPADSMESWRNPLTPSKYLCNWAMEPDSPHVGEVQGKGKICVMAPTIRADGGRYERLPSSGREPQPVSALTAALGIHPVGASPESTAKIAAKRAARVARAARTAAAAEAPPTSGLPDMVELDPAAMPRPEAAAAPKATKGKAVPLESLLGLKARKLLTDIRDLAKLEKEGAEIDTGTAHHAIAAAYGQAEDRSALIAAFASEAYGKENDCFDLGLPIEGGADELIEEVADGLSRLDSEHGESIVDKLDRILGTISRDTCDGGDPEKLRARHAYQAGTARVSEWTAKRVAAMEAEGIDYEPEEQSDEIAQWLTEAPFALLGYTANSVYVLPEVSGVVQQLNLKDLLQENTLRVLTQGLGYWEQSPFAHIHPKRGLVIDWKSAGQALLDRRAHLPIYDPTMVRGRGCWLEGSVPIMHLGDCLLTHAGGRVPLSSLKTSRHCYAKGKTLPGPADQPLSDAEALGLAELLQHFPFEEQRMRFYLLGWIASALVCGALPWRPNGWITGTSGCGKSTLMDRFVEPLMADSSIHTSVSTTEAGLRQTLQHDSLAVLFDEIESEDTRAHERVQSILRLMRGASSPSGAHVLKGTADGEAQRFVIRSSFLLSSVVVGLRAEADLNRTVVFALEKLSHEYAEQWDLVDALLADITADTGRALLARVFEQLPTILENCAVMKRALQQHRGTARAGDVYGVLSACALAFYPEGKKVLTVPEALEVLARYAPEPIDTSSPIDDDDADNSELVGDQSEVVSHLGDTERCLGHLLQQEIRLTRKYSGANDHPQQVSVSIERALQAHAHNHGEYDHDEIEERLLQQGLKIVRSKADGLLVAVAPQDSHLEAIYRGTPWAANGWARVLLRHPQCAGPRQVRFRVGTNAPRVKGTPVFPLLSLAGESKTTRVVRNKAVEIPMGLAKTMGLTA
jgi:hypothetical protein